MKSSLLTSVENINGNRLSTMFALIDLSEMVCVCFVRLGKAEEQKRH